MSAAPTPAPARAPTRAQAVELDAADPLAGFRDRFLPLPADVTAYLDGNSLGRPLASIAALWGGFVPEQWAGRLIRGWTEGWLELPERVGDELGAAALGAAAGQVLIADSTTVNLYKCLRGALRLRPGRTRILADRDDFPTDRYVVQSLARDLGLSIDWLDGAVLGVTAHDVAGAVDERTAVVLLSQVAYRSGHLADVAAITAAAHAVGALTVWDLSHAVGCCEVALDAWQVDLAVGCTYKFLGAGPGAPAFLYAAARHQAELDQPIWGWLGRRDPFEMEPDYVAAAGIRSMLSGTPPVLGVLAVREGARVVAEAGLVAVRAKAESLGSLAVALVEEWLLPLGFALASPPSAQRRGGHVSIARADARELCGRLIEAGVVPDFRTPDLLRLGLSPLSTSHAEVWDALAVIRDLAA